MTVLEGHNDWVNDIVLLNDNRTVVSCSSDTTVRIWRTHQDSGVLSLSQHTDYAKALAYSPGSQTVASAGLDHEVFIWDVQAVMESFRSEDDAQDGDVVCAVCPNMNHVHLSHLVLKSHNIAYTMRVALNVAVSLHDLVINTDHDCNHREECSLWCCHELLWNSARYRLGGRREYSNLPNVSLWNPCWPDPAVSLPFWSPFFQIMRVYDPRTGTKHFKMRGHTEVVRSVVTNREGTLCLSASSDATIKLWGKWLCLSVHDVHVIV